MLWQSNHETEQRGEILINKCIHETEQRGEILIINCIHEIEP